MFRRGFQFLVKLAQTLHFLPQLVLFREGLFGFLFRRRHVAFQTFAGGFVGLQAGFNRFQRVVNPGDAAHRVVGKDGGVGKLSFQADFELRPVERRPHGKSAILAQIHDGLRVRNLGADFNDGLASRLALLINRSLNRHGKRVVFGGMALNDGQIRRHSLNKQLLLRNLAGVILDYLVLHRVFLRGMARFENL